MVEPQDVLQAGLARLGGGPYMSMRGRRLVGRRSPLGLDEVMLIGKGGRSLC